MKGGGGVEGREGVGRSRWSWRRGWEEEEVEDRMKKVE